MEYPDKTFYVETIITIIKIVKGNYLISQNTKTIVMVTFRKTQQ